MTRIAAASAAFVLAALLAQPVVAASNDLGPLLSNQIVRCWNPPAGSTGVVAVHFELTEDGHIVGTPVVDGLASAGVAKAAIHAVEFCQPYRMPPARFSDWQHPVVKLRAQ